MIFSFGPFMAASGLEYPGPQHLSDMVDELRVNVEGARSGGGRE